MKILVLAVGKTTTPYIARAVEDYIGRIGHYVPVEMMCLPDRARRSESTDIQREREGEAILAALQPSDRVILLDERGVEFTSREFAAEIERRLNQGLKRMVFVIGGPYGFSRAVYDRADAKLSLSRMTFSHEMVRLFFVEQVYRAMTILRGEPYHHD